MMVSVWF